MRLLFLGLFFIACTPKEKSCNKFKTGIFELYNEDELVSIIERDDEFQIEYKPDYSNVVNTLAYVHWDGECNFTLFEIDSTQVKIDNNPVLIEIVETKENVAHIQGKVSNSQLPFTVSFKYEYIKLKSKLSDDFYIIKNNYPNLKELNNK